MPSEGSGVEQKLTGLRKKRRGGRTEWQKGFGNNKNQSRLKKKDITQPTTMIFIFNCNWLNFLVLPFFNLCISFNLLSHSVLNELPKREEWKNHGAEFRSVWLAPQNCSRDDDEEKLSAPRFSSSSLVVVRCRWSFGSVATCKIYLRSKTN